MSSNVIELMKFASFGRLPWSIAIIWLISQLIYRRMSKAKPELVLTAISFIVIISVAVLVRYGDTRAGSTTVSTGDITQQGTQNAAGIAGNVTETGPCSPGGKQ